MKHKSLLILSIFSTFMLGGCNLNTKASNTNIINNTIISNEVVEVKVAKNETTPTSITKAVDLVYDSVVVINAYKSNGYSSGSGVLFATSDNYSYIITCHHVIEDASRYVITFTDESTIEAKLVGGDPVTDIAVLAIEKTDVTLASFIENSDDLILGETAIVIGNPLGTLSNSITSGIISSKSRDIKSSDGTTHHLLQTDAAINSGNSGGGLFDISGNLVGIVSSKYSAAGIEGLGFAIPANIAKQISYELLEHGYIEGRYELGITISDGQYVSGGFFGERYNVVYISNIESNGSSYGLLKENDILTGIKVIYKDTNKESISLDNINSADAANNFISNANLSVGDKLIFSVKRSGVNGLVTNIDVEILQYKYQ